MGFERTLPVVMGLGPSGLFLARQLSRLGCPVAAIARPSDVGLRSNKIAPGMVMMAADQSEVEAALEAVRSKAAGREVALFVSSDQYLTALLTLPRDVLVSFGLPESDIANFELMNDKARFDGVLGGIARVPEAFSVPEIRSDAYPCVDKWNEKRLGRKSKALPKIREVATQEELDDVFDSIRGEGFCVNDLVVQSLVQGDNSFQFSSGGYYREGVLLAGIVVTQARQYPQGISAYVEEACDERASLVEAVARKLAESLNFSGFLEIECKFDSLKGDLFVLDVNPRPWGWISILGEKYPTFHRVFCEEKPEPVGERVAWRTLPRDFAAWKNPMNCRRSSGIGRLCLDIWDPSDIGPFCYLGATMIKKAVRR